MLRPQDVQAIVTGLASNPDTLAVVAWMIWAEHQPTVLSFQPSTSFNQTQMGKFLLCCLLTTQCPCTSANTSYLSPPSVAKGVKHSEPA